MRSACELAVAVAQLMEWRDVPVPVRRYLKMQRLPAAAVAPIRRVLDDDPAFRSRVADVADEAVLDRASWLFLARPDGWASELTSLAEASSSAEAQSASEREERSARRKLASVEDRLAAAEGRVAELSAALASSVTEASSERASREAAEQSVASLSERVDALRHERDDARSRLARAEARLTEVEAAAAAASPASPASPPEPAIDVAALREAIAAAAGAADALHAALAAAASIVGDGDGGGSAVASSPPPAAGRARRDPLRLPGGVFDDSIDAAEWLVRQPGVAVVVDGYNCTLRDSPFASLPIGEQRRRLVDALVELASRTHADVEVVFDGADVDQPLAGRRRGVRVTFSDPGVEADDVVIERSSSLPADRPLVVASSDNRVRAGAAGHGANVITAEQLMAILRTRR